MAYIGASPAYGVFNRQVLTGDGSTTTYNLDYPVSSATQLLIVLDGIVQEPEYSYTVSTSAGQGTVTFSEAPDNNARASVVFMGRQLLVATQATSSPHIDTFNGDGSTTAFTLGRTPSVGNGANIIVFVEGVYQRYGASSILSSTWSGSTLISITGLPNALRQYSLNVALVLGVAISYYPNAIAKVIPLFTAFVVTSEEESTSKFVLAVSLSFKSDKSFATASASDVE
jgi:hypothetical protein